MWDPYGEFQSATLPNGLTVYAAHWPERPWEAVGFIVYSGAEQDPVGLEGLAHFIEHLVSKNADLSRKDINAFFEEHGGNINTGSTGYECTLYDFFVPTDRAVVSKAFSLFGQMLLSSKMERFIERERQVIIGEFHRSYSMQCKVDLEMRERKSLYRGCWFERFITPIGTPESVGRITQADLQAYYDTHYTPANISVVCVGGMKLDEIVQLLSESPFAGDKKGKRTPLPSYIEDINPPLETHYIFEVSKHVSTAEPVAVGSYRSVAVIPNNVNTALRILKNMLNEILDDEVRQSRAWAYDIRSEFCNFRHFHEFAINCGALKLESLDTIDEVVETCIASLTDREDLFEQTKRRAIVSNFMVDPMGRKVRDNSLDDLAGFHRIISLAEYGKELETLTMRDIRNLLKWIRPERRWTVVGKP